MKTLFFAVASLTLMFFSQATHAAQLAANGLVFYSSVANYVEVYEFASISKKNLFDSLVIRPNGQSLSWKTEGILAVVNYPPVGVSPENEAEAQKNIQNIVALQQRYPKFKAQLQLAESKWKNALEMGKQMKLKEPVAAKPSPTTETLSFTTTDGRKFENVTISGTHSTGISVLTDSGVSRIDFEQLPPQLQQRFHFDPAKAAALREKEKAQKQEVLADRSRKPFTDGRCIAGQHPFTTTSSLADGRTQHTATLLSNGKVLVAGGGKIDPSHLASTAIYDPSTSSWEASGNLIAARAGHTATLLPDGKVMVAGGMGDLGAWRACGELASAELYDPATGAWTATGNLSTARAYHRAIAMLDGRVLIIGGDCGNGKLASSEIYDPATGKWTKTGSLNAARGQGFSATLLSSGKVLVAGGGDKEMQASSELYDPTTGVWTATGSLSVARAGHTATLLPSGKVLVAGGDDLCPTTSEVYDPITGTWTVTESLHSGQRCNHTATLLPDGKVLVAGGIGGEQFPLQQLASAELYDPESRTWTDAGTLADARSGHSATLLAKGCVILIGGVNCEFQKNVAVNWKSLASAELYDPSARCASDPNTVTNIRGKSINYSQVKSTEGEFCAYPIIGESVDAFTTRLCAKRLDMSSDEKGRERSKAGITEFIYAGTKSYGGVIASCYKNKVIAFVYMPNISNLRTADHAGKVCYDIRSVYKKIGEIPISSTDAGYIDRNGDYIEMVEMPDGAVYVGTQRFLSAAFGMWFGKINKAVETSPTERTLPTPRPAPRYAPAGMDPNGPAGGNLL